MNSIISKSILISIFSILILSGCGGGTTSTYKAISSSTYKTISSSNIKIQAPDLAENGEVVPISVKLVSPLKTGDTLTLSADGEEALQLKAEDTAEDAEVNNFSVRIRSTQGYVSVKILRANGKVEETTKKINVRHPASNPPLLGKGKLTKKSGKIKFKYGQIKILFNDAMAIQDHIENVKINLNQGKFSIKFTPKISRNPYLAIEINQQMKSILIAAKNSSEYVNILNKNKIPKLTKEEWTREYEERRRQRELRRSRPYPVSSKNPLDSSSSSSSSYSSSNCRTVVYTQCLPGVYPCRAVQNTKRVCD